ncbi:MAG: glutathione S-transferase [Dinoroseobacter sp.]|jgi:glutathione S-transferase
MSYHLIIGDYAYSSWSLRGWLLFERFAIARTQTRITFLDEQVVDQLAAQFPAKTVPTIVTPEGAVIGESLAVAEELATRHPEAGLWPSDPKARAIARTLASEMHAGFTALRGFCPMNLRVTCTDVPVPDDVKTDLRRLELIWDHARETCASEGPWLCGDYSVADAFFAPVATRIATYGLEVSDSAQAYVAAHLADPAFRRWRALGLTTGPDLPWYAREYTQAAWPGPKPLAAHAVESGPCVNAFCPYSGKPVSGNATAYFLKLAGKVYGFCNTGCRDKTIADPEAWPAFMALVK